MFHHDRLRKSPPKADKIIDKRTTVVYSSTVSRETIKARYQTQKFPRLMPQKYEMSPDNACQYSEKEFGIPDLMAYKPILQNKVSQSGAPILLRKTRLRELEESIV